MYLISQISYCINITYELKHIMSNMKMQKGNQITCKHQDMFYKEENLSTRVKNLSTATTVKKLH